jgi:hypothetical protein
MESKQVSRLLGKRVGDAVTVKYNLEPPKTPKVSGIILGIQEGTGVADILFLKINGNVVVFDEHEVVE